MLATSVEQVEACRSDSVVNTPRFVIDGDAQRRPWPQNVRPRKGAFAEQLAGAARHDCE